MKSINVQRSGVNPEDILKWQQQDRQHLIDNPQWFETLGVKQQEWENKCKDQAIARLRAKEEFFSLPVVTANNQSFGKYQIQEGVFDKDTSTFRTCGEGETPNALFMGRLPDRYQSFEELP